MPNSKVPKLTKVPTHTSGEESADVGEISQVLPCSRFKFHKFKVHFHESMVPPGCILFGGTVPPWCILFEETVPPGCILKGGTVPPGCILNGGTVPPFNLLL